MKRKYLGPDDREKIAAAWSGYAPVAEIATMLGVARKTIYSELKRGSDGSLDKNGRPAYDPELAQRNFQSSIRRRGRARERKAAV